MQESKTPIVLNRWFQKDVPLYGGFAALEMKALNKREAPQFAKDQMRHWNELIAAEKAQTEIAAPTFDQQTEYVDKLLGIWDSPFVRRIFTDYVRLAQPVEIDGVVISDAVGLLDLVPADFLRAVLSAFNEGATLKPAEVFPSGSRSTSDTGAGPDGSGPAAHTTEPAASSAP